MFLLTWHKPAYWFCLLMCSIYIYLYLYLYLSIYRYIFIYICIYICTVIKKHNTQYLFFGLFWVLLFWGIGRQFQYYFLFLETVLLCFHQILEINSWNYLGIIQKVKWHVAFILQGYFKLFLGPIFVHCTVLVVLRNPKYSPEVYHIFSSHYGKNSLVLPLLGRLLGNLICAQTHAHTHTHKHTQ